MARFFGPIGFVTSQEQPEGSGIWVDNPIEKNYRGEISKNSSRREKGEHLNKDIDISNTISIVADPYMSNHVNTIRYVKWLGSYWEITSIEVESPRLILSVGGVYNGPTVGTSRDSGEHPRIQ